MELSGRFSQLLVNLQSDRTVLTRESYICSYTPVGRSFYSANLGRRPLGEGLEAWRGFYQSIRPTQMGLSLNIGMLDEFAQPVSRLPSFASTSQTSYTRELCICDADMSATAFLEPQPVIDFVEKLLGKQLIRPLTDVDRVKVAACLLD